MPSLSDVQPRHILLDLYNSVRAGRKLAPYLWDRSIREGQGLPFESPSQAAARKVRIDRLNTWAAALSRTQNPGVVMVPHRENAAKEDQLRASVANDPGYRAHSAMHQALLESGTGVRYLHLPVAELTLRSETLRPLQFAGATCAEEANGLLDVDLALTAKRRAIRHFAAALEDSDTAKTVLSSQTNHLDAYAELDGLMSAELRTLRSETAAFTMVLELTMGRTTRGFDPSGSSLVG